MGAVWKEGHLEIIFYNYVLFLFLHYTYIHQKLKRIVNCKVFFFY